MNQDFSNLLEELKVVVYNLKDLMEDEDEVISMKEKSFTDFLDLMINKLSNCQVSLHRDYLKCVFIGRTSNGKSSVINALLGNRVVPTGVGHTTNCFITLITKDTEDAYIEHFQESDLYTPVAVFPLSQLKSLSNALSPTKVESNDTIKVYYPYKLTNFGLNVHIVDSPGVDIDNIHDKWIDVHCLDADVFVLVTNAESILMQCERRFFTKVKEKFNIPNILIVNNRWDSSSDQAEEEIAKVKKQQMDIFKDFLINDLNICTESEVESRVFFISALEEIRSQSDPSSLNNVPGRVQRSEEFKKLENILKDHLSEKVLKNKMGYNLKAFRKIFEELNSFINCIFNSIVVQKEYVKKSLQIRLQLLKNLESDVSRIHQKAANYIERLVMKSRDKLSHDFHNLVCNLESMTKVIVLTFDPYSIKDYLSYQHLVVENFENLLFRELKAKTMTYVNGNLKIGVERLTKIYTEMVLSSPSNPVVNQCLLVACQPPIHDIYPMFSAIMNEKINNITSRIVPIPSKFVISEECADYLNNIDNRYSAYCNTQVDEILATGASVAISSTSKYPEVTLMIPKFSTLILPDYFYTPGFRFSLSPASLNLIYSQWHDSHCPIRSKMKSITWSCITFVLSSGVITYTIIAYNCRYWKQGFGSIFGIYGGIYLWEKYFWDRNTEINSLKNQFTNHCKKRLETIIHISAVTTARQLGSFLHLDLKGLQHGSESIINEFHEHVDSVKQLENKVLIIEKKYKKIKSNFFIINQQISAFQKEILCFDFGSI